MNRRQNAGLILLGILVLVVGYGVYRTRTQPAPTRSSAAGALRGESADVSAATDEASRATVEQLIRLPTAPEERPYAQSALRLADQEFDLAFAQAVRQMAARPRAATPAAKEIEARLQQARQALAADKASVVQLTAAAARATPAQTQQIADRLSLANAMTVLDQDEIDDAEQDLIRAGGDPQAQMQAMTAEHEAAAKGFDSLRVVVTPAANVSGLVHHVSAWRALHEKAVLIAQAKASADSLAGVLARRHDRMESGTGARFRDSSLEHAGITHDSAATLVAAAQRRALATQALTTLDHRVDNQRQLATVYDGWRTVLGTQERGEINGMLRTLLALLAIGFLIVLLSRWSERVTVRLSIDRRRAQTLHMVLRVTVQVVGILVMLLVIFGPPNNLGTFLGLTSAGLLVALKDFIVGFMGWLVLMGPDGIRIGEIVEINGVTGEVVELGMFHTVLLETGNWGGSAAPTGRRVTFPNGFAIEGHYFNFSTSGQWLWDSLAFVVPGGRDPQHVAGQLQAEVEDATSESARQAEAEWRRARRSPHVATLTATPSVSLRPVAGGVEVGVRYVTRVAERAEVRARLYRKAMDLLSVAR